MMAPAPGPEAAVMPAAPVVAPKAADDMSGSIGLGVGVVGGSTGVTTTTGGGTQSSGNLLVAPDTGNLMLKWWLNDGFALSPRLAIALHKTDADNSTSWSFAPEVLGSFGLIKGLSTRLSIGVGLGFAVGQAAGADVETSLAFYLPVELSVEHFFTRWFSMGIAIHERFLEYTKLGDAYTLAMKLDTLSYMGSLFFYTD
jgi:hypothetical protein